MQGGYDYGYALHGQGELSRLYVKKPLFFMQ